LTANVFGKSKDVGIAFILCFPPATADAQPTLVKPRGQRPRRRHEDRAAARTKRKARPRSDGEPPKPVADLTFEKALAELFVDRPTQLTAKHCLT